MNPTEAKATVDFFRNLDATIASFGDGHVFLDNEKTTTLKHSNNNDTEQENRVEIEEGILKRFSPAGLEDPFKQLYSIIFPALYRAPIKYRSPPQNGKKEDPSADTNNGIESPDVLSSLPNTFISSSSAAILMGVKGSGKTLLLERVLAACREQLQHSGRHLYRMVEINGIVSRGEDVASVVYEMIRQLSGIAYRSIKMTKKSKSPMKPNSPDEEGKDEKPSSMDSNDDIDNSRKNGGTNEIIGRGRDRIDDGKETFDEHEKAITLYEDDDKTTRKRKRRHRKRKQRKIEKHMLRLRKATFNSNLALLESILKLAATDNIPILLNLDELDSFTDEGERQMLLYHFLDRVATPGSNLILVGMTSSFSALTLLEKRIRSRAEGTAKIIYLRTPPTYQALLELLECKLEGCTLCRDILDRMPHPKDAETVANAVLSKEKSHTHGDVSQDDGENTEAIIKISNAMEREFRLGKDIRWFSRVIATSLTLYRNDCIMEVSRNAANTMECDSRSGIPLSFRAKYVWNAMAMMGASVFDSTVASRQPDLCIIDDSIVSPRLQALLDLSTPQVALMLSARRILKREEHRDQAVLAPLTMERMLKEHESFRRGSISMGDSKLLKRAVYHLMQQGLLVPSIDHSGGGPLQYDVTKIYRYLDPYVLSRLPLHVPVDIDRELGKALEQNLLECPTALKEWGKSISKGR
jgi:Cdc6-like AAA superfamily ATPase